MIQVNDVVKVEQDGDVVEGVVVLVSGSGVAVDVRGSVWTVPANGKRTKHGRRLFLPTPEELVALEVKRRRAEAVQALIEACRLLGRAYEESNAALCELEEVRRNVVALLERCGGARW